MTKEEKIKEAAQKYVGFIGVEDKITLTDAFKIGAEWVLANQWHEISRDKNPNDVDILIRFEDGSIKRYDEELPELLVTHWCEIPQFKEERK